MNDPHREALAAAALAMNQGDLAAAEKLLCAILAKSPHPVAFFILGQARAQQKQWPEAEQLFRRALDMAPGQRQVLAHLAQALRAQHRAQEAETLLGQAQTLAAMQTKADLAHQRGLSLKREHRFAEALASMEEASAALPHAPRIWALERADLLRHLGKTQDAAAAYRTMLQNDPLDLEAHHLLAELTGADDASLASYDEALTRNPRAVELPLAKGRLLLRLGRPPEAESAFRRALDIAADPRAFSGLASALETADSAGARAAHLKALQMAPTDSDALENFTAFLLRQGHCDEASVVAERARRAAPLSQSALALSGLAWRALGDARDAWLNDYDAHVQIFDLEPPEGFGDMGAFNRELGAYLETLHGGAQEYFTQTLRGGTQLHDEMFYNGHALVDRLLPRINAAVAHYIYAMRGDADHPLAGRRSASFRYAGSWSSRLKTSGFHDNHVHQQGWISSCYYVAVPDAVKDQAARQGWIKFGEPTQDFGQGFAALRAIEPKPGRLVLFPSYMWHGTNPFHAASPRITIAFDAVPD